MKVSIVTSCRNRSATISSSIESVLSQDYSDIEHVIVDGASTDGTLQVINKYRNQVASITSEPDHGMYEGINKGLRKATGDVIGLLHSDDVFYASDTISRIVAEFERTGADLVYGNGIFVKAADMNYVVRDWISGGYEKDRVRKGWLPLHTTVFVRREVFERVGMYNEKYKISADTDWLVRCLYESSLNVAYLDEYVVRMRMGGASTNYSLMRKKWKEDLTIYKSHNIHQYVSLSLKIASKVPQFVKARFKRLLKQYDTKKFELPSVKPSEAKIADVAE